MFPKGNRETSGKPKLYFLVGFWARTCLAWETCVVTTLLVSQTTWFWNAFSQDRIFNHWGVSEQWFYMCYHRTLVHVCCPPTVVIGTCLPRFHSAAQMYFFRRRTRAFDFTVICVSYLLFGIGKSTCLDAMSCVHIYALRCLQNASDAISVKVRSAPGVF